MSDWTLHLGDCLDVLPTLPDGSVDSVITDPPAGIGFMGLEFDSDRGGRLKWVAWLASVLRECLRVAKPGATAAVWALPRTSHWTGCAVEEAGWEIFDVVTHLFGGGFPKGVDVGKALDRQRRDDLRPVCRFLRAALDRAGKTSKEVAAVFGFHSRMVDHWAARDGDSQPACPGWEQWLVLKGLLDFGDDMDAEVWRLNGRKGGPGDAWGEREVVGRGTAGLGKKPAFEGGWKHEYDLTAPATDAARLWDGWHSQLKPAAEFWWLARKPLDGTYARNALTHGVAGLNVDGTRIPTPDCYNCAPASSGYSGMSGYVRGTGRQSADRGGRYPANVVLGCACEGEGHAPDCPARLLDEQAGRLHAPVSNGPGSVVNCYGDGWAERAGRRPAYTDSGGASRFFYCAKASRAERGEGNKFPCVKPLSLMRWLCRLTKTPTGGVVLDPFAGSGTTLLAALLEGRRAIGIEKDPGYAETARKRLAGAQGPLFAHAEGER